LLSLIYPTSGNARVFGRDVTKEGPDIRKQVGYLPSEVFYYDDMRVIDLLRYSASFYDVDSTQRMDYLSDLMGLELNRRIRDLSYGNKKKVGIVQGLLHSPRLLLLDEPTSGLDPLMQRKFFELIREENKRGVTVFFSSHILGEVQRLCQRVAIIREGSLVELANISSLQKNNYKKIRISIEKGIDLSNLPGVANIQNEDSTTQFFYRGDINLLLRHLDGREINDLNIEEPTLEEIFMHYYE
jgi:ABC-2 type transport system ATP-binding protein